MKTLIAVNHELFSTLFSKRDLDRIRAVGDFLNEPPTANPDKEFLLNHISDADIIITSWGTAALDAQVMAKAAKLRLLTHAAGSVKPVVSPELWKANVKVTSAAAAIACGVAEFCLGLLLTASKRAFWGAIGTRQGYWAEPLKVYGGAFEIYQQKVGIIGASHVGKHLIRLLKNFTCDIVLFDPYCSSKDAEALGVTKVDTLEELFSSCVAISLNAPSTEETRGMLRGKHFSLLRDGGLFINTARSAIINEPEFIEELRKGRFVACLDVTDPEPCPLDHPYRRLPNVILTPHEAGVIAQNKLRIGTFVADEITDFIQNKPLHFPVTEEMLARIG